MLVGILLAAAPGCDSESGSKAEAQQTYWTDVAPIYYGKCVGCHQEGGIAPFRLDTAEDASAHAAEAAVATETGMMPPFYITHDGSCGDFDQHEALTTAEKKVIADWARGSRPAGTARALQLPPPPTLTGGLDHRTPVFTPIPAGGQLAEFDEYRCFPVDNNLTSDAFLTGYEVLPGNPKLVHHVLMNVIDPSAMGGGGKTNAELMAALDASELRDGWPCFGAAGDGVNVDSIPVDWAPGQGVISYPAGMGVRVRPTDKLVVQVHYNLADPALRGAMDSTTVRLRFADRVERQLAFTLPDRFLDTLSDATPASLPPGRADATYSFKVTGEELGLGALPYADLVAVMPHMHERGRQLELRVGEARGAAGTCAARTTRWDFHWQRMYSYSAGKGPRITPASELEVTCRYDTTRDTQPVFPGWGTRNEMCLTVLMVALPPGI